MGKLQTCAQAQKANHDTKQKTTVCLLLAYAIPTRIRIATILRVRQVYVRCWHTQCPRMCTALVPANTPLKYTEH